MQKLITLPLFAYNLGYKDNVGVVTEHLGDYLSGGWRIVSMMLAGGQDGSSTAAWLAVLLERDAS
jgi:hypothetical protein